MQNSEMGSLNVFLLLGLLIHFFFHLLEVHVFCGDVSLLAGLHWKSNQCHTTLCAVLCAKHKEHIATSGAFFASGMLEGLVLTFFCTFFSHSLSHPLRVHENWKHFLTFCKHCL